jgi:glycosyltransferase involved in cell wall biosynthesis
MRPFSTGPRTLIRLHALHRPNRDKTVLIIQGQMKQYRVPFFTRLRDVLRDDGVSLRVAYGEAPENDGRNDQAELPPELGLKVNAYRLFSQRILYHPLLRAVAEADLVIAEQSNKYLLNYLLVILSVLGCKRVAFWGLGESKAEGRSEFSEWVRRRVANKVDWWFAYTPGTKAYLTSNGVSERRITVVFNAVDTGEFSQLLAAVDDREVAIAKQQLEIQDNDRVGLFVGALLPDKGLGLLVESAKLIKTSLPSFHLLVVGGGPEQEMVQAAAQGLPWIHFVGPKFGREKAIFFKMADALLLPGRVGLVVLDSFAAGLPLVTIDVPYHGPEVEYFANGKNGLLSKNDVAAYASEVVSLFSSASLQRNLRQAALDAGRSYSIDAMVGSFREGIHACLA